MRTVSPILIEAASEQSPALQEWLGLLGLYRDKVLEQSEKREHLRVSLSPSRLRDNRLMLSWTDFHTLARRAAADACRQFAECSIARFEIALPGELFKEAPDRMAQL